MDKREDKEMRYKKLGPYLKERFGERTAKVTLYGGTSCPNRDGTVAAGGCTYCLPEAIVPEGSNAGAPIIDQLRRETARVRERTGAQRFIAYFQPYTATYGDIEELIKRFSEALAFPGVVGLAVSARPDCLDDRLLDFFAQVASSDKEFWIEMGLQSANDSTLKAINRGHTAEDFKVAAEKLAKRAVNLCCHLILGLPDESKADMFDTVSFVSSLPVWGVKFHQLQIVRGTPMEEAFERGEIVLPCPPLLDDYASLVVECLELLRPDIVVHRLAGATPRRLLASPSWGVDTAEVTALIERLLEERVTRQGTNFSGIPESSSI